MNYLDGRAVRLGDKVDLGGGMTGTVVCVIENAQYTTEYRESDWDYLKTGALVVSEQAGLLWYSEPDQALQLVERGDDTEAADDGR
jgi:hypothetical protein